MKLIIKNILIIYFCFCFFEFLGLFCKVGGKVSLKSKEGLFRRDEDNYVCKFNANLYKKLKDKGKVEEYKKEMIGRVGRKAEVEMHTSSSSSSSSSSSKIKNKNLHDNYNIRNTNIDFSEDKNLKNIGGKLLNYIDINNNNNKIDSKTGKNGIYISKKNQTLNSNQNYTETIPHPKDIPTPNILPFTSSSRKVKFYISHINECNVLINDTIKYSNFDKKSEFINHLILNNNAESITPRAVYADDPVEFFIYNKIENMFTILADQFRPNFTMEYHYSAVNLIKSQKYEKSEITSLKNYTNNHPNDYDRSNNTFLWKFYNENSLSWQKQELTIEVFFSIDKHFENQKIFFYDGNSSILNFEKAFVYKRGQRFVRYKFVMDLLANEAFILQSQFPMFSEKCGRVSIEIPIVITGAFFILFMISVIYMLITKIVKLED